MFSTIRNHDFLIHCDSDNNYYTGNKPYNFYVKLPKDLVLDSSWNVALVDILWTNNETQLSDKRMYIESDFVVPSVHNNKMRQIIGSVPFQSAAIGRHYYQSYNRVYVPVLANVDKSVINLYLKGDKNEYLSYLTGPLTVQLHFKRF